MVVDEMRCFFVPNSPFTLQRLFSRPERTPRQSERRDEDKMAEKSLTPTTEPERMIAVWGARGDLKELAERVRIMAPGGAKLTQNEALGLAQGALASGLNPFLGELWMIPGHGLMTGIKGLRKAARQQIVGNFWGEWQQIVALKEREVLGIPEGAMAFRYILRDSETIRAYAEGWGHLVAGGVPVAVIPKLLGEQPYTEGVGIFLATEKSRMGPAACAKKRAEADALKQRFDIPLVLAEEADSVITVDASEWGKFNAPDEGPLTDEKPMTDDEAKADLAAEAAKARTTLWGE